jgi:hypothetical protein
MGVAERFVCTVRSECLDWLLILNQQQLELALAVFVDHYNVHRPHRALALTPPHPTRPAVALATGWGEPVSSVAIVSVVWFTSTSWRRDQICEPNTMRPAVIDFRALRPRIARVERPDRCSSPFARSERGIPIENNNDRRRRSVGPRLVQQESHPIGGNDVLIATGNAEASRIQLRRK